MPLLRVLDKAAYSGDTESVQRTDVDVEVEVISDPFLGHFGSNFQAISDPLFRISSHYEWNILLQLIYIIIHPILLSNQSIGNVPGDRKIKCRICTVNLSLSSTDKIKVVLHSAIYRKCLLSADKIKTLLYSTIYRKRLLYSTQIRILCTNFCCGKLWAARETILKAADWRSYTRYARAFASAIFKLHGKRMWRRQTVHSVFCTESMTCFI